MRPLLEYTIVFNLMAEILAMWKKNVYRSRETYRNTVMNLNLKLIIESIVAPFSAFHIL